MPEHGIAYKKISGKTYVYYVTATYRNFKKYPYMYNTIDGSKLLYINGLII